MAYQTVTLSQLQTMLSERTEGQPFWTPDMARRALNEAIRIYNLVTGMYRSTVTGTLIPDDAHYYVGGMLVKGTRVRVNNRTLTLTSIAALDRLIPNWSNLNTAAGGSVPTTPVYWCPVGLTEIMIYPKIAPPNITTAIEVAGVMTTPVLVSAGDYLNIGQEDLSALLAYAVHVLSFSKGADMLRRTEAARVAFFKACALRNAEFEASSLYRKMTGYDRLRSAQPMVDAAALQAAQALQSQVDSGRGEG